jgi:hypothetical protein
MKDKFNFYLQLIMAIILIGLSIALGSCTEEVIVPGPERIVYRDTSTYKAGPTPTFVAADTVKTTVVITKTDTLIQIQIDSVFVTQTIHEHDTVTHYIHHYHDTLYVATLIRPVNSIPEEIKPYFIEFFSQAFVRGANANGGVAIVQYVLPEDMPGEGWASHSYWVGGVGGNMVIELNGDIAPEYQYAGTLRELARLQLKRKYVKDESNIMSPLFPPQTVTIDSPNKSFYLDQIFNPLPI